MQSIERSFIRFKLKRQDGSVKHTCVLNFRLSLLPGFKYISIRICEFFFIDIHLSKPI